MRDTEVNHHGHRKRMKEKLATFGERVFDGYELLEMLLYYSIPVRDTNLLSKALIKKFGSLDGVLSASAEELTSVGGVGEKTAALICAAGELYERCTDMQTKTLDNYEACGEYLLRYFEGRRDKFVLLLSFDNKMRLLGADELYALDYSSGAVQPRIFIDTLVKRRASVAVIAHNHPFGATFPTESDIQTNIYINDSLRAAGYPLLEHYIISGNKYMGFMEKSRLIKFAEPLLYEKFYGEGFSYE